MRWGLAFCESTPAVTVGAECRFQYSPIDVSARQKTFKRHSLWRPTCSERIVLVALGFGLDPNIVDLEAQWRWPFVLSIWVPIAYAIGLCMYQANILFRLSVGDHTRFAFLVYPDRLEAKQTSNRFTCLERLKECFLQSIAWIFQYPSRTRYEVTVRDYCKEGFCESSARPNQSARRTQASVQPIFHCSNCLPGRFVLLV